MRNGSSGCSVDNNRELKSLLEEEQLIPALLSAGLSPDEAGAKSSLFTEAARSLIDAGADTSAGAPACFVPGRLEVLGKHTDYVGGRSIVATIEKGFCTVAVPREDPVVSITDAVSGESTRFEIGVGLQPEPGQWSNYPMTVARRLAMNFPGKLLGADIAFSSDLPVASGTSTSSALITTVFMVLAAANNLEERREYADNIETPLQLAEYLACIENGTGFGSLADISGVGTMGGSEDHTAILCCEPGTLHVYSYRPTRLESAIEFPAELMFVIAASGVTVDHAGERMEKYNRLSMLAREAIALWNRTTKNNDPHPAAVAKRSSSRFMKVLAEHRDAAMTKRIIQFLMESEDIIPAAVKALQHDDLYSFGQNALRSQQVAEEMLGNQIPETIFLADYALQIGAEAASAFGGGFGGSVWALCRRENVEKFTAEWERMYTEKFPDRADTCAFYTTVPGPAAFTL